MIKPPNNRINQTKTADVSRRAVFAGYPKR